MRFVLVLICVVASPTFARPGTRYRAAVVEIGSVNASTEPTTLDAARKIKLQNAAMLEEWTAKAAKEGAQIVVFGEDFASSGWALPRGLQNLYAEPLPQPGTQSLCSDEANSSMPLATAVACTAIKYNITIATGLADLGPCVHNLSPFTQKPFPCDQVTGLTAFNAIGVFGPQGNLLAKYHKSHLARMWTVEFEHWAEVSPPEVVTFEAPFGIRFGMFICNDINLGGPTRALLQSGVRDIIFPTLWINFGPLGTAVGMQDGFSRAHGVNLLAANGNELGLGSSGSGIWPAELSSNSPQYYTTKRYIVPGEGWMGVADLVSPNPADSPVSPARQHPAGGLPINGTVSHFHAFGGARLNLSAATDGLVCFAEILIASGSGWYALIAYAGLGRGGWYSAYCAVMPCRSSSADCGLMTLVDNMSPLPTGGAVFRDLKITSSSEYANTFYHTAICDGGLTVAPRSGVSMEVKDSGLRELQLSGATCPLMTAYIEGRAQSEDERQACPYNKYPCSNQLLEASSRLQVLSRGSILNWQDSLLNRSSDFSLVV